MQNDAPETLQEAIVYFSDDDRCHAFAVSLRWPDGVTCVHCGSMKDHVFISTRKIWRCRECKKQFSVRLGTVMEDSPLPLSKWMTAMWLIVNCKNGISSYEIARDLGITQKSAWHLLHRIRAAMKAGTLSKKLAGIVEADETYIGGALKNMHKSKREAKGYTKPRGRRSGGPFVGKTIVTAVLERDGEVRAQVLESLDATIRREFIKNNVELGSKFMTDMMATRMTEFVHQYIDHAQEYVNGEVHTNSVENFWSLLKRGLKGTYVAVEPFHLSRYVDEQSFRFNNRKTDDADRFVKAFSQISGRRLTWDELTRKAPVN